MLFSSLLLQPNIHLRMCEERCLTRVRKHNNKLTPLAPSLASDYSEPARRHRRVRDGPHPADRDVIHVYRPRGRPGCQYNSQSQHDARVLPSTNHIQRIWLFRSYKCIVIIFNVKMKYMFNANMPACVKLKHVQFFFVSL